MPSLRNAIAILMLGFLTQPALASDLVPDAASAIKIGAATIKAKLGDKAYSNLKIDRSWQAMLENVWYVWAEPKHEPRRPCKDHPKFICMTAPTNGNWYAKVSRQDGHVISVRWEKQP